MKHWVIESTKQTSLLAKIARNFVHHTWYMRHYRVTGQIGTEKYISINQNEANAKYDAIDDVSAVQHRINWNDVIATNNKWVPIKKENTSIYINKYKIASPANNRTQFLVMLSWACTVHEVQGLSLNSTVISFDLEKQKLFNQGQIYVALSRVTVMPFT